MDGNQFVADKSSSILTVAKVKEARKVVHSNGPTVSKFNRERSLDVLVPI